MIMAVDKHICILLMETRNVRVGFLSLYVPGSDESVLDTL
jgi:hypothetical protein